MSDVPQGPGWWQASDGKWYPPESFTGQTPPQPESPPQPQAGYPGGGYPPGPTQPPGMPPGAQPNGWVGYGMPVVGATPKTDPMAIAALVLGIAGIPLLCFCYVGVPLLIAAIPLGFVSRKRIKESQGALTGDGLALAGALCGIGGLVLLVLLIVLVGAFGTFDTSTSY